MLSAKAKGKQRAVEPVFDDLDDLESQASTSGAHAADSEEPMDISRDLVVRFTEGMPDLTVSVDKHDSAKDVKRQIRDQRPELLNRRLRLIHSGRLLADGTSMYSLLTSVEERQQRTHTEDGDTATVGKAHTTWVHCSVGPAMAPDEEEDDSRTQTAQIQLVRGFDRLASLGFSPEDIDNFRRQFHSQSSSNYLDLEFSTEEEYEEHARALEEQWIDSIDNAGTATLSQTDSSSSSVIQGVLVGFFFPFMPIFFMRSQKPAVFWNDDSEQEPVSNVILSRKMSMGLVVGFLINVLFGMWRYLLDSS
ncbi:hypothetical protein GALMADRAFT_249265 [Galerina marginata CBS 339.88]|uniref:Ubiquitin-like domain-containing protein n=1 Tax=Galerina marginata (strain CBS 339.88) TaxID=685588 RepID=A0A067T5Q9_GALM3|nr:hypothetical protein GALMADRAFT_249265 [Galerina marginata CBS 339.88]